MKKLLLTAVLIGSIATSAIGCGAKAETKKTVEKTKIVIGASSTPHAEILEQVKPILKKAGFDLEIKVFDDYVLPNTGVNEGSLDANFFQHVPYLTEFNAKNGTKLVPTVKVHVEPLGVYSKKIKDIKNVTDGAKISIPSDASNGSRALKLLAKAGLFKLSDKDIVSKLDITENPKKLVVKEIEAAQLPRTLDDVQLSVINTNYAIQARLNPLTDSLFLEDKDSPYANIIVVKEGNQDTAWAKALGTAINSPEIKQFILDKYKGQIVPAF